MNDKHVGTVLRYYRVERKMTLTAAAKLIGVTRQQLKKYETGECRVSIPTVNRLLEAWGVWWIIFMHQVEEEVKKVSQ